MRKKRTEKVQVQLSVTYDDITQALSSVGKIATPVRMAEVVHHLEQAANEGASAAFAEWKAQQKPLH